MEKITKEVLKEETFYKAIDGKEFESEDSCIMYEMELKVQTIEAYNDDFDKCDFEDAKYVVVHSEEEISLIEEVCEFNGWTYEGIDAVGLYRFSRDSYYTEGWERVTIPSFLMPFVRII